MRVDEMRAREDYERVLRASVETGLTQWTGRDVRVVPPGGGQSWWYQPLFSAYHADAPGVEIRSWLRDSIRRTPSRVRAPAQFVVGTLAATSVALRISRQPGFSLDVELPSARETIILPGNQKIRALCFKTRTSRVWSKSGFSSWGIRREVDVRGRRTSSLFRPIISWGDNYAWYEEELIPGVALPRCEPRVRDRVDVAGLLGELSEWSARTAREVDAIEHSRHLAAQALELGHALRLRFGRELGVLSVLGQLAEVAGRLGRVLVASTHGDLQPGNIMVEPNENLILIDWEHAAERFWAYDLLVFGFGSRFGDAWVNNVAGYLAGRRVLQFVGLPRDVGWRRSALALFVLEDLVWYLREADGGPYRGLTRGLVGANLAACRVASLLRGE